MIIRSQNKIKITNFNQITDIVISKNQKGGRDILVCYPYCTETDCGYSPIATYSTEEKAIKVLDMIAKTYAIMKRNEMIANGSVRELSELTMSESNLYIERFTNVYCFDMPSEEEVEV